MTCVDSRHARIILGGDNTGAFYRDLIDAQPTLRARRRETWRAIHAEWGWEAREIARRWRADPCFVAREIDGARIDVDSMAGLERGQFWGHFVDQAVRVADVRRRLWIAFHVEWSWTSLQIAEDWGVHTNTVLTAIRRFVDGERSRRELRADGETLQFTPARRIRPGRSRVNVA